MTDTFRRILAAVDGSSHSDRAFALALRLAMQNNAALMAVYVIPDMPTGMLAEQGTRYGGMAIVKAYVKSSRSAAQRWMDTLITRAADLGVHITRDTLVGRLVSHAPDCQICSRE